MVRSDGVYATGGQFRSGQKETAVSIKEKNTNYRLNLNTSL